jgi:ketosteroid isomerase-like protein
MWEDAVMQPPDRAQIQGHDAIREFFAPTTLQTPPADSAPPRPDFPVHVSASGDLAVEWGPSTIMVKASGGSPTIVRFKFVTVWERRGGVWKVRLNSWNADPSPMSQ